MRMSDWSSDVCSSDLGEAEMLRRPHLMLANLGGDDRVAAARRLEQRLDRALRHAVGVGFLLLREVEAAGRAPAVDTPPPFAEIRSEARRVGTGCVSTFRSRW